MFMGIVAPPNRLHGFDGKIMMKRVSRQKKSKTTTYHQRFSVNYHLNQLIKQGEWKETCFMPGMLAWQLFETLQDTYDLEDDTVHSLVTWHRPWHHGQNKASRAWEGPHLARSK